MIEEWKLLKEVDYNNYIDKYYISNYGRCKINDIIVQPRIINSGYNSFGGELLHRSVYNLFKEKIKDGLEIDHIDGNRTNNRVDNLRAVTHKENCNNPITLSRNKGWNNLTLEQRKNQHKKLSSLRIGSKLVIGSDGKKHWAYANFLE